MAMAKPYPLTPQDSLENGNNAPQRRDSASSQQLENSCVRGIKQLVDEGGIANVPEFYTFPHDERPDLSRVCHTDQPPVIDLAGLLGDDRRQVIEAIGRACEEWGIFQVINHGVPQSAIEGVWAAHHEFFQLSAEERMRWYSSDPYTEAVAYLPVFRKDWDDSLMLGFHSGESDILKEAPAFCREPILEYHKEMRKLAVTTCKVLSESLGVDADHLERAGVQNPTYMKMHYYPPCPDPSLALGKEEHTDPNFLTFLIQDQTGGLQVLREDRWVAVTPVQNSFIINMGDQLEILTNGKYKSVEHRVVTNADRPRSSVAFFTAPSKEARIAPMAEMINEQNPQLYKETAYMEYLQIFGPDPKKKHALRRSQIQG